MKTVITHLPLTKARINLGQVVRRVHLNRECFILEKDGIPVAGLMHIDDVEDYLEMQNPAVKEQIRKSYAEYRRGEARDASHLLTQGKTPARHRSSARK